ncbi:chromosome segregation protein SMC [candidate division WOR-3 bacterium]|nr:chromosome segregation protein SMC [candidate division WOR-3 bacterium]
MRIKELQLIGFKSFQDKATLRFSPGLNAVVGPNGCGKTNVLDALRWVLGEQSFTLLRCAKNEDLIFGGTATVAPVNIAEVKLVLDDVAQTEGQPAAEVEIKRRYFRSGESEYYLNKQPCRLRDIQEVFFSSGAGTKAYSIFDLRQMREIISGNIRKMFEEAASLAKYQDAKADCLRKLDLTNSDLLRLDDIIAERERYVRSLQRQAGRLRAFDKLKTEEKGLRLIELKADYEAMQRDLTQTKADTEAMEQAEAARVADIRRLEEELKTQRGRVRDLQVLKDELGAKVQAQRQAVSELEGRNLLARQRIELLASATAQGEADRVALEENVRKMEQTFEQTLARLAAANERQTQAQDKLERQRDAVQTTEEQLYGLRSHEAELRRQVQERLEQGQSSRHELARLEAALENQRETSDRLNAEAGAVKIRLARNQEEVAATRQKMSEAEAAIAAGRARLEALRAELARARDERQRLRIADAKLREERAGVETELALLRAATASEQAETSRDALAEGLRGEAGAFVEVTSGWERACEAALYAVVDFLVADAGPEKLAETAGKRPDLRFGFLTSASDLQPPGLGPIPVDSAIAGPLSSFVKVKSGAPAALRQLVDTCLVAGSTDELDRLSRQFAGWTFVTQGGVCRFPDGRLVAEGLESGRLSAGRAIREKGERLTAVDAELERIAASETTLGLRREELEKEIEQVEFEVGETGRRKASLDAALELIAATGDELGRDVERLRAAQQAAGVQTRAAEERRVALVAAFGEFEAQTQSGAGALERTETEARALEQQVKAGLELSSQALAELSEARQAGARLEAENAFAKRQIDDGRRRLQEYSTSAERNREETKTLERETGERAVEIEQARSLLSGLEDEFGKLQIAELARAEEALEANLAELRQAQERNQTVLMEQRMQLYELNQRFAAIVEEARSAYGTDIASFQPEGADGAEERLVQVRQRLEALGQVNPLAVQEYAQEKSDLAKLVTQREDVAAAKMNLESALTEIDRHAQEQFAATYGEVRSHFREIFQTLFLEGEADLVMTNDANPLESDIGIVAKPRGKNPKRLEQLSDGEKALLAVSLLFAFYRVKPAPFCFLDEVDAPLDDANVGRFADYLKGISEKTQVVIITHNRLTVERADVVFGVTAEQPGISTLVSVSLADYRGQAEPATAS